MTTDLAYIYIYLLFFKEILQANVRQHEQERFDMTKFIFLSFASANDLKLKFAFCKDSSKSRRFLTLATQRAKWKFPNP